MTPRLECAGLTGGYGTTTAFRDVDLAVEGGTIEALLGPNGAGKTTLLLTLAGFLPPQAGTITVDGTPLKTGRPSRANKAGIGARARQPEPLHHAHRRGEPPGGAVTSGGPSPRDMLDVFPPLEKRAGTLRAGALSGGEQQMLAMARALIQEPRVLLIDEMSMGLAPLIVESLFDTVQRIAPRPRMRGAPRRAARPTSRSEVADSRGGPQPRLDRAARRRVRAAGRRTPTPSRLPGLARADDLRRPVVNGEAPSNVSRLRELAAERPDTVAYVHLAMDGTESSVTWSELDRRSSQLAAALSSRGVGYGDRVGLGIRNSPELVFGVLATWKLGAVPIPVRWDVPDWELDRLKEVIAPKVYIGADDLSWIATTADDPVSEFPEVVSPNSNGICSSGATGTPKVILSQLPAVFNPMMGDADRRGVHAGDPPAAHPRARTDVPHQRVRHAQQHADRRSAVRAREVRRARASSTSSSATASRRSPATPTMLQRIADVPGVDDRDLSSLEWIMQRRRADARLARAPVGGPHRRREDRHGLRIDRGPRAHRADRATNGWNTKAASVAASSAPRCASSTTTSNDVPLGEIGQRLRALAQLRRRDLPRRSAADPDDRRRLRHRRRHGLPRRRRLPVPGRSARRPHHHRRRQRVPGRGRGRADRPPQGRRRRGDRASRIPSGAGACTPSSRRPIPPIRPTFDEVKEYTKSRLLPYKVPKSIEIVDAIPRSEAMKVNRGRLVEARGG